MRLAVTAARHFGVSCSEAPQLSHNKKIGAATGLSDVGIFCEKFVLAHLFDYFRRICSMSALQRSKMDSEWLSLAVIA